MGEGGVALDDELAAGGKRGGAFDDAAASPFSLSLDEIEREIMLCTPGVGPDPYAYFGTTYCHTLDDEGRIGFIPPWQFALDYFHLFESGEDGHVEKTRQMLATWLACACYLCSVMFRPGFQGFMGSRKEKLVDDGGENSTLFSLFGRIRFMYDRLPEWMRERYPVRFSHLRIDCPTNGSFIVGEAANREIGRGGTFTNALVDEAAIIEASESSHRSIRLACQRGLIYQSTPNGRGNVFAKIKFETPGDFRFLRLHWMRHPERRVGAYREAGTGRWRSPWYDRLAAVMSPDARARELDISYAHSVSGLVWPEFDEDIHVRADLDYDPNLPFEWGLDFGIGAATAGWGGQIHGEELWVLNDYELQGHAVEVHARNIEAKTREAGWNGTRRDIVCWGDPAGNAREMVRGSTVVRAYKAEGYVNFFTPKHLLKDGLALVGRLFHQRRIFAHPRCKVMRKRIPDFRFPTNDAGDVMGDEPVKGQPSSHSCDGGRYLVAGRFPIHDGFRQSIDQPPLEPLARPIDRAFYHEPRPTETYHDHVGVGTVAPPWDTRY